MNRKELIETVLRNKQVKHMSKKDATVFANVMFDVIKKTVKKGNCVSLVGFGTFSKVRRAARGGVNPGTGEKIRIKAKNLPKFRPGQVWRDMF